MSKGIFGLGCSFTWGEGLYFYSNLDNLPFNEYHSYDFSKITNGMIEYKNKHRFIQLISNNFDTWCTVKNVNGTNNTRNIQVLKRLYNSDIIEETHYDFKLNINDYKLIVFQFTSIYRDEIEIDELLIELDKYLKHFEAKEIKVVTLTWMDEIFSSKTYQERYLDRHVNIKVGDTEKTSFEEFIHDDSLNITVRSDYKNKNLQINDTHLNHKGNQIFANSIIEKLQQDNFKI